MYDSEQSINYDMCMSKILLPSRVFDLFQSRPQDTHGVKCDVEEMCLVVGSTESFFNSNHLRIRKWLTRMIA